MEHETKGQANGCCKGMPMHHGGPAGACGVYGVAFIGAAVYYIQHAVGFWGGVLGVLKALVWPAMLAYKALEFFGM